MNPVFMSPNYRPLKPLNGRLLRTNINIKYKAKSPQSCPSNLYVDMGYKANPKRSSLAPSLQKRSLHEPESFEQAPLAPLALDTFEIMQEFK